MGIDHKQHKVLVGGDILSDTWTGIQNFFRGRGTAKIAKSGKIRKTQRAPVRHAPVMSKKRALVRTQPVFSNKISTSAQIMHNFHSAKLKLERAVRKTRRLDWESRTAHSAAVAAERSAHEAASTIAKHRSKIDSMTNAANAAQRIANHYKTLATVAKQKHTDAIKNERQKKHLLDRAKMKVDQL